MFFASFLLFMTNGRLASYDGGQQLQSAMVLVTTGNLGAVAPPGFTSAPPSLIVNAAFVRGIDGRFYECHDIGSSMVMVPAALFAVLLHPHTASDVFRPPLIARVLVSFTNALISSVACLFLFKLFLLLVRPRYALALTSLYVVASPFLSYVKTAEDVLGCCCAVCLLLYTSAALLAGRSVRINLIASCVLVPVVGMFRLSVMPFFALSLLMVVLAAWKRLRLADLASGSIAFLVSLSPIFWFNWIRTGSIFRAAITLPVYQYQGSNLAYVAPWEGLWGVTVSPNKGTLVFCPFLLLLFALPWVWKRLPVFARSLLMAMLTGSLLHTLLIACLAGWYGGWGWGDRYMLPLIPVFWVAASCAAIYAWPKLRSLSLGLMAASVLVNLPLAFINGHLLITEGFNARKGNANLPYAIMDAWHFFLDGLRGRQMPGSAEEMADPVRRLATQFPDLWTVYIIRASHNALGVVAGVALSLLLLGLCGYALLRILRIDSAQRPAPASL
jgi:hypothetical protein